MPADLTTKLGQLVNVATATPGTGFAITGTLSTTGALTYGGVTLSNSVTGTGSMVLSAAPALTGNPTITNSSNAYNRLTFTNTDTGTAAEAAFSLVNSSTSAILGHTSTGYNANTVYRQNATYLYGNGAGGLTLVTGAAQPIYFAISSSEKARIDTSGRLLVGRTTAVTPSGTSVTGCYATGVSVTDGTNSIRVGTNTITFDDNYFFINNAAVTGVYLANGATAWTAYSARELKHNIKALNAHDVLRAVGDEAAKNGEGVAVLYDLKNNDRREAGSIAQNWLAALPEIVERSNPERLGLMYDRVGAIAAQGVYEQLAINEALKVRIEALEARVKTLENN